MYYIKGLHIYEDQSRTKGYYIREILDHASCEYQHSKLSPEEKYKIISELGLENLTRILKETFHKNHKPYEAKRVAVWTYEFLRVEVGVGDWDSFESRLKKALDKRIKR